MGRKAKRKRQTVCQDDITPASVSQNHNVYLVWAVCFFILFAVFLVFGQTLRYDFVNYDDDKYVYENPQLSHGLTAQGIAWAFTSRHTCNWHPLTWLSLMLDYQLYGLKPGGYHLTNVLLHAATAMLLFLVLLGMSSDFWPSAFTAALFAVHPLRVETVAWVAERKDVLSGLFFVLTLWFYLGYVRRPFSIARYLMAIVFFGLGLMAKPMLVTVPFVLLLLDYWPLRRMSPDVLRTLRVRDRHTECAGYNVSPLGLVLEKAPLLVMSAASCVVTIWAQSEALADSELTPLYLRINNALVSYFAYLGQFFYPAGLALPYPHPGSDLPMWKVAGTLLVLAAICVAAVVWKRRYPYLLTGWFWYLGMLLPVIGLVQVGSQAMADRYTYLPQIGLCIALAWGVANLCRGWTYRFFACGAASVVVLVVLIACAWRQTSFWRNSETLWLRSLDCTSPNFVPHYNLAIFLGLAGRTSEAIEHYQEALKLKPEHSEAHNNMGNALARLGRNDEAIEQFQQALIIQPDYAEADNNLGVALVQSGRIEEAGKYFEKALTLNPDFADAHNNLGGVLLNTGQLPAAADHFKKAIQFKPNFYEAHNNLGIALANLDRPGEAIEQYKLTLQIKPDFTKAYFNLARAYAQMNRPAEAIAAGEKTLTLARSQGDAIQVKQVEDWMNSYRTGLSVPQSPPP
jgi:protein O-mannosyl-transferase